MKLEDEIKQRKFATPAQKALVNILFTSNWVNYQFRELFKNYDLTQQQYNVLRILRGRYPNSANPSEIKDVMLDKNPDLTRLCDRMCAGGWISREIDENNRRKMNIKITAKGLKLLERIDPEIVSFEASHQGLTDEEYEQLSDLLDKFRS